MYKQGITTGYSKRLQVLLLCVCIMLQPLTAWSLTGDDLPDFGAASGNILSPAAELRLGKMFMRYVRASQSVLDDPLLEEYLKNLGESLVDNSDGLGSQFRFFFVDDPQINAFAGPAGHIGIDRRHLLQ